MRTRRVGEYAGLTAAEAHRIGLATPVDLDVQPRGQGVDDGCAHAVQATGGGIRTAAELAPRVQLGEDQLDTREPGPGLGVHGNAAAVVADLDRPVATEDDLDTVADAGQRFVDCVVDDLPEAVHQPALVGGTDIHPWAFADRFQAFEHLKVAGGVVPSARAGATRGGAAGRAAGGHWMSSLRCVDVRRRRATRRVVEASDSRVRGARACLRWVSIPRGNEPACLTVGTDVGGFSNQQALLSLHVESATPGRHLSARTREMRRQT